MVVSPKVAFNKSMKMCLFETWVPHSTYSSVHTCPYNGEVYHIVRSTPKYHIILVGGIPTPLKIGVRQLDDEIPNMMGKS